LKWESRIQVSFCTSKSLPSKIYLSCLPVLISAKRNHLEIRTQTVSNITVHSLYSCIFYMRFVLNLSTARHYMQKSWFLTCFIGPLHQHLSTPPLLGDTTSNGAILFSPPFALAPNEQPTYPNYTLPLANLTQPTPPSSPNFTLILSPTSSSLAAGLQTGCKLASTQSSGNQISQTPWLRDQDGWRSQWLIGGLTSATNYTAFVIQDNTKVSGPIYLATKSGKFARLLRIT
jgi:hypothetical protein